MPAVSIIIPVYNIGKYLEKCLDSVIAQTFPDIEIIVVNDGSTDNSPEIIARYADKDPRIVVIDKANEGLAYARKSGIEAAIYTTSRRRRLFRTRCHRAGLPQSQRKGCRYGRFSILVRLSRLRQIQTFHRDSLRKLHRFGIFLGNLFFQGPLGGMELFAQTQSICKQHYIPARIKLWRRRFSHDTIVLLLFPCRCVEKPTASTLYHTGELHHQQPPQ